MEPITKERLFSHLEQIRSLEPIDWYITSLENFYNYKPLENFYHHFHQRTTAVFKFGEETYTFKFFPFPIAEEEYRMLIICEQFMHLTHYNMGFSLFPLVGFRDDELIATNQVIIDDFERRIKEHLVRNN